MGTWGRHEARCDGVPKKAVEALRHPLDTHLR
ncbi:predicted protein [Streptomyces viridosporus ATCC 14672]|uniref:Predicted protein n=1 Tax=Streptomyces viridosporus (strain ATCC 14672 / DSM 40746 / JCM 4963 / KCTC 9882 / NRRL B-12104 / FH 1290) TaxID=566461 RepID=D5ZUD6_STRV1|nr:predicted protein [Streptomyces viridosporus ATCC 14672]